MLTPLGFVMGAGFTWLFGASTPSLFGGGVLFVLIGMWQSAYGKSVPESVGKKVELVAFTLDPAAADVGEDGDGPYVVIRKRKGGKGNS